MNSFIYMPSTVLEEEIKQKEKNKESVDYTQLFKLCTDNYKKLMELDRQAEKAGSLVGRVISHPAADGAAYYQVIKEGKRSCTIRVCVGIGDDWSIPAWGEQCSIPKSKVYEFIGREESMNKIFGGSK